MACGNRKRTSLADVAAAAGVDVSTVSLVLNDKPLAARLRSETRQRIMEAARALDYRPSLTARSLQSGRSGMIGMVVGDIASLFYSELTASALRIAEKFHRRLIVSATEWAPEKEQRALSDLLELGVDGILYLPGSLCAESPLYRTIRREKLPLVTFDRRLPGASAIHCDHAPGFDEAVRLFSLRHRKIGYLGSRGEVSGKIPDFRAACARFGCEAVVGDYAGEHFHDLDWSAEPLLAPEAPKAWIIGGGEAAVSVLNGLLRRGVEIPGDVELAGISVARLGEFTTPSLARLEIDCDGLMRSAFGLFECEEPGEIRVPVRFVPAGSVKYS